MSHLVIFCLRLGPSSIDALASDRPGESQKTNRSATSKIIHEKLVAYMREIKDDIRFSHANSRFE